MQTRKLNRISEKLKLYSNIFFRKFSGAMHRDIAKKEGEVNVLPESLVDLLLNDTYRKYLNTDGTIIQGREENYNAFTWFVESVLKAINHDFTNGEMKSWRTMKCMQPDSLRVSGGLANCHGRRREF